MPSPSTTEGRGARYHGYPSPSPPRQRLTTGRSHSSSSKSKGLKLDEAEPHGQANIRGQWVVFLNLTLGDATTRQLVYGNPDLLASFSPQFPRKAQAARMSRAAACTERPCYNVALQGKQSHD